MGKAPMWKRQAEALEFAVDRVDRGKGTALFMECGTGKALPLATLVLTPTGWTTMGALRVGDSIIGQNGKVTSVVGVYPQGKQALYRVTFSDGTSTLATLNHLWEITTSWSMGRKQPAVVLSTGEMLNRGLKNARGTRKYFIPIVEPVQFKPRKVPIDPYLLGALLGNGCLRKHGVVFSNLDLEILDVVDAKLKIEGVCLRGVGQGDYGLAGIERCKNSVLCKLRGLDLLGKRAESKFIPKEYLFNSIQVRTELLRGLLDTDGAVDNTGSHTGIEYSTASPMLAEQVKFLVQSLGGTATVSERFPHYTYKGERRQGQLSYRLYLCIPNTLEAFKTSRKCTGKRTKYQPTRAIESIEPEGSALCQCIKVSALDGLFVINDCIVTHNTRVAIHWLEHLFRTQKARLVYVVAPLSALHVWPENWAKWAAAPIVFIDLHEERSAGLRRAKKLAANNYPVVCLVNYESTWQIGYKRIPRTKHGEIVRILEKIDTAMHDLHWDAGILDESTFVKSPGSKVSKYFRKKMAPRTRCRMILSGSAYTKRPLDVWAQVNFACSDEVFASTFQAFRSVYAVMHQYIRGAVVGYHNLGDLVTRLSKVAVMLKKTDILDLPPFVHETRLVELCTKSRKVYDDLVEETIAELDGGTVSSDHIFTTIRKLAQITSGFVYPDGDEDIPDIKPAPVRLGTEKLDVLMDILEERDAPTVIITQFNEEEQMLVEAIRKKFGFIPKVLNGSVRGSEARRKMIESAAADPVFIIKEAVGARGIDVKFADLMVFYSHSYNTEAYTQILSRNHRGGQTKSITYIHLLCRNSIDMRIMKALQKDLSLAESIEGDWRRLFV